MTLLKKGDKGDAVKQLQQKLKDLGYTLGVDGNFGNGTDTVVRSFQTKMKLSVDGVVGNGTMSTIDSTLAGIKAWKTSVPFPATNKSRAMAMPTLTEIGRLTNVDPKLLATFCSIESAFDYTAKPYKPDGTVYSSAEGWFQFLDATWDDEVRKHGKQYSFPVDPGRSLRKDPRANGLMGAEFLKGNAAILRPVLGHEPSDTDLYLAHFMGAGGAKQFLMADQNKLAAELFPGPAKANPNIFYKSGNIARTLAEVYAVLDAKVAKHRA
ncbi:transglycosylase [Pseudomonas phage PhiPA3]|uniref:Uncharacterized protein 163 n=1 Tax=Pseudomonas phage PhiPA3 TaxID=998086 RepID=F8SK36_BPPA3|nr:transglycosylase [Pseudomonas phage PhiPA3]AEH03586.1 hypothetical protein [Pseudomonas phage PhiPA3]